MRVTKTELVAKVATQLNKSQSEVSKTLNTLLDTIVEEVGAGNEVVLTSFATFKPVDKPEMSGVMNGVTWTKPAHKSVKVKVSKKFIEDIA